MSQNHIGESNEKVPGMIQERTERDFAKDREIVEAATLFPLPHWAQVHDAGTSSALRFAAQAVVRWPAALDEIDRLNAVINDKDAQIEKAEKRSANLLDDNSIAWKEVERLEAEKRDLTAKVQERDKEIERLLAALYRVGHQIEPGTPNFCAEKMIETARSALKGAE